jgi:hypothetical protein
MKQEIAVRFRLLIGGIAAATLLAVGIGPNAQAQKMSGKMQTAHFHAKITAQQAQSVALIRYPGKVEGKVALENEEGSWQYAVNVRSGKTLREVMVNATTGKIANVEVTTKAEETREQKAEMKAGNHKSH